MITALLVDDEPKALDRLAEMLGKFAAVDVIGRTQSVAEAEQFLRGRIPDVVFLDITMPERLGIDLLATVPPETKVVFVTARESHAVDAFRAGAIDYILKPYDQDRLGIAIDRLEKLFAERRFAEPTDSTTAREAADQDQTVQLSMAREGRIITIPYADILWIEAVQNYSRVQLVGLKPAVVRRTMGEWEARLPAKEFARISRSLIVQTAKIRATQWQSRDQMLVFFAGLAEPLPIGRTSMTRIKELLRSD
jgi:two-component system LytT family response regulator